jgi:crotonobetainyl-CoA:carnitine CoA-transferase CaiB-like acyl-CoA transferase
MSITGEGPDRPPVKVGAPVTDITAGILAALGVCAAYARQLRTGEGQVVDTSLFEAGIVQTYWQSAMAFATGVPPQPLGSAHPLNAPYQAFETADGWINVGAANQRNWERLARAIGAPELLDDPHFTSNRKRMQHLPALVDRLAPIFQSRSTDEWLQRLEKADVPAGPVLSIPAMHRDPQTMARAMVVDIEHPIAGRTKAIGSPLKFSAGSDVTPRSAPRLGEHTREVLTELGYAAGDIDRLIEAGAAVAA